MQHKSYYNGQNNQNIMASILQSLPRESSLTKIEYEGPNIALYSDNPAYLLKNSQIISNMVNTLKKRIVIRTDESIRKSESETLALLRSNVSKKIQQDHTFFDPALGEATIYIKNPFELTSSIEGSNYEIVEKTGWKFKLRKKPSNMYVMENIHKTLYETADKRIQFYKDVGERIFRSKLANSPAEASIVTLGGFAEVGRSAMLLSTHESKILLDCGLNPFAKEPLEILPRLDITGVGINDLDAVVLSHAHLSHSGFLPFLFKYGYDGPVYCSEPTLPLMSLELTEYIRKSNGDTIYSLEDIKTAVVHTIPLNLGVATDISPDVKITLTNSCHVLGSSMMHLHIGNGDHNVVYTGEMRFRDSILFTKPSFDFTRVETLIIESTYGNKEDVFPDYEIAIQRLVDSVNSTLSNKEVVLIPVPYIGLAQEISLIFDKYIALGRIVEAKILVEKVIADVSSIHEVYSEYLSEEINSRVHQDERSPFQSKHLTLVESHILGSGPAIVICPLFMNDEEPLLDYLKQLSQRQESKIIFVSYQMPGTLGRCIQEGKRQILLGGQEIQIRCIVEKIDGLDVHSDYSQLLSYVSKLRQKLRRVMVNHGERPKVQNLATSINRILKIQTQHPLVLEAIKLV
jgi:KH/beta-lactamase-domain protein